MFNVPSQEQVDREGPSILPEGRYDVTITGVEGKRSSKGHPMLVIKETVDNGPETGRKLTEFLTFFESDRREEEHPTWRRLAIMMDAAGFTWEPASSIQAFAAQFPLNELRLNVEVVHRHTVTAFIPQDQTKKNHDSKRPVKDSEHPKKIEYVDVTPKEYEEWPTDDKSKNADVMDAFKNDPLHIYREAQNERELQFAEDGSTYRPSGDGAMKGQPTQAEVKEANEEPDDDLPF